MTTIPTLTEAKDHLRIIGSDLDPALAVAIEGAQAEIDGFIGGTLSADRWPEPEDVPGDVKAAGLMLVRCHFEEGDPEQSELWRGIAQKLLVRYRTDSGIGGA